MYRLLASALQKISWLPKLSGREDRLAAEAELISSILHAMLIRTNHITQPDLYARLGRINERARQRSQRRAVAATIALYRGWSQQIEPDHPHYYQVIAALGAQSTTNN